MKAIAGIAALAAMIGGSALAADLPTHKGIAAAPMVAPPGFNWTGFYVGVNGGYSFSEGGNTNTTGSPAFGGLGPAFVPGSLATGNGGFLAGGTLGYNYQIGNIVAGLETDIDYVDQRRSASFTGAVTPLGTALTTSASHDLDYLGTFRGRIGFTPFDRMLLFATGGLAYGGVRTSGSVTDNSGLGLAWNGSNSQTRLGWTLGGGGEYAFTNNITFKVEGLYYDLGHSSTTTVGNAAVQATPALNGVFYTAQTKTAGELIRGGLNFKF